MMRIGLAAVGFKDKDIDYNKNTIINLMKQYSGNADMLVFGESFLQGFEVLTWKYEEDKYIAKELTDAVITEISEKAKQYDIAVSFGFIEIDNKTEELHSTQITIGDDGKIVNVFRRVSEGWKEGDAINNLHYTEGREFPKFTYKGYNFSVGLCGDFWYDDNADIVKNMNVDAVLWPVYTDYNAEEWNNKVCYEYEEQAGKIGKKVLLVNSVCLNRKNDETASGSASAIINGKINRYLPAGEEGVLVIEI